MSATIPISVYQNYVEKYPLSSCFCSSTTSNVNIFFVYGEHYMRQITQSSTSNQYFLILSLYCWPRACIPNKDIECR